MNRPRDLARAAHPGPALLVTALAAGLAIAYRAPGLTIAAVVLAVAAGQASVGWSNDWLDSARDVAVARQDKPVVAGLVHPERLRTLAFGVLAVCIAASLAAGITPGAVHLVAVGAAWAYNAALKRTLWSFAPYAIAFPLLVTFVALAAHHHPAPATLAAAALLGVGAHAANVLPDIDDDEAAGIRGLPHRLGRLGAAILAAALLLTGTLVTVVAAHPSPPVAVGVAAAALALAISLVAVAWRAPTSRLPFTLAMTIAALNAAGLVAASGHLTAG